MYHFAVVLLLLKRMYTVNNSFIQLFAFVAIACILHPLFDSAGILISPFLEPVHMHHPSQLHTVL